MTLTPRVVPPRKFVPPAGQIKLASKITKTQAIRERRASQPDETQQQTADAVGCDKGFVSKVVRGLTERSESEPTVNCPSWVTHKDMQAAFRKLPHDERARLESLPANDRRGAVRQAAIAAGIVKVPSGLDQLRPADVGESRPRCAGERRGAHLQDAR